MTIKKLIYREKILSGFDMSAFNPVNASNPINLKLESFFISPSPTPANIEFFIYNSTFLLTSNPAFTLLSQKKRQIQSTWADRLLEARKMAGELERVKQKEKKKKKRRGTKM